MQDPTDCRVVWRNSIRIAQRWSSPPHRHVLAFLLVLVTASCGLPRLDPDQIAARISIRPASFALGSASVLATLEGRLPFRAGMQACNRNGMDILLVEAPWTVQLHETTVATGTVQGPIRLPADACLELVAQGEFLLASVAAAGIQDALSGQIAPPVVLVDAVVQVYGVTAHRKLRLDGFTVKAP